LVELVQAVDGAGETALWLELLERKWGMVIATARLTAEQRREEREHV
jgi:hypothetical protein